MHKKKVEKSLPRSKSPCPSEEAQRALAVCSACTEKREQPAHPEHATDATAFCQNLANNTGHTAGCISDTRHQPTILDAISTRNECSTVAILWN